MTLKANTISNMLLHVCAHSRNTYLQGSELLQNQNFNNRESDSAVVAIENVIKKLGIFFIKQLYFLNLGTKCIC